jgi:hypothetical protein
LASLGRAGSVLFNGLFNERELKQEIPRFDKKSQRAGERKTTLKEARKFIISSATFAELGICYEIPANADACSQA